jgi:hypothetical protein
MMFFCIMKKRIQFPCPEATHHKKYSGFSEMSGKS